MKILIRTRLSIFTVLCLTGLSLVGNAQAEQDSIKTFSWEGLSLSMTPDQMVHTLVGDGYTQLRVTEGKKKLSIYRRKTGTGSNKVQFVEKDGALIKLIFSEMRTGGKKNLRSPEAADSVLERIKNKLGINDSSCTPAAKGGGKCLGQPGSATHHNSFNVSVNLRALKITLVSKPISQAILESNKETADGLASAYGCLGTTDMTSVKDIYECIDSVSKELEALDKAKKINRTKHMPVYLSSTTTPCWQLSNFYKRGLSYVQKDSDSAPLPSCATFAAVIKLASGSPAFWSACMNENESDAFLKSCIDRVNPSYFKLVDQRLPTCKDYQLAYQRGVVAAHDTAINASAVALPECGRVMSFAKSLREPLAEELLDCAGYDPDHAEEHLSKCITSDRDLWLLKTCEHVQALYRRKLMQSNYGYLPDAYIPIACDQTKELLATAKSVLERLEAKEAERRRQAMLRREDKEYMKGYMKEKISKEMAERYGDTPEKAATRTSQLEKEIKANGGNIRLACKALGRENIYCPPTLEEIRLAMMRNHSQDENLRMIDGHMIHGDLNATAYQAVKGATMMMGGSGAFAKASYKYLGVELLYGEPVLLRDCTSRSVSSFDCYFKLALRHYVDKRTIQESGYTVDVSKHLQFKRRKDFSYYFWIGKDGLWHSKPTEAQIKKDQEVMDYEEKVFQEGIESMNQYIEGLR